MDAPFTSEARNGWGTTRIPSFFYFSVRTFTNLRKFHRKHTRSIQSGYLCFDPIQIGYTYIHTYTLTLIHTRVTREEGGRSPYPRPTEVTSNARFPASLAPALHSTQSKNDKIKNFIPSIFERQSVGENEIADFLWGQRIPGAMATAIFSLFISFLLSTFLFLFFSLGGYSYLHACVRMRVYAYYIYRWISRSSMAIFNNVDHILHNTPVKCGLYSTLPFFQRNWLTSPTFTDFWVNSTFYSLSLTHARDVHVRLRTMRARYSS